MRRASVAILAVAVAAASASVWAQRAGAPAEQAAAGRGRGGRGPALGVVRQPLGDGPFIFDTAEQHKLRVVVVTKALVKPWSMAFLPDGSMLITELQKGQLRLLRNGVLEPAPVTGVPQSAAVSLGGLMDVVLHPRFADNHFVYLTYSKPNGQGQIATAPSTRPTIWQSSSAATRSAATSSITPWVS
jgi:glucose/arabinose dehydrogenase